MQKPHERLRRKIEKENLWLFVLSVINKHGMLSGSEIKKKLMEDYGLGIGKVTSYKVLYLLNRGGYVSRKIDQNKRKKLYAITRAGKEEMKKGAELLRKYFFMLKKYSSQHETDKKRGKRDKK